MRKTVMHRAGVGPALGLLAAVLGLTTARAADDAPVDAVLSATYSCESGRQIRALYNNAVKPDPSIPAAQLIIDGVVFAFHQIVSADGARYGTEQGFEPDKGLIWWTKGEDATLFETLLDDTSPGPKVIDQCTAVPDMPPGMEMEDDSDGDMTGDEAPAPGMAPPAQQ